NVPTVKRKDNNAFLLWGGVVIIPGIALLYLQLYRVTCDQTYLLRSLDYVKRTLRNLNGRRVTFLCGDAGPLAVGAVVYHKLKSDCESQECITKLLQLQRAIVCRDSDLPDELLQGRAGYLYALLYVSTEMGPGAVCGSAVKEVVDAIIESGKALSREEKKAERCPLLYQWHRKQYVGAAHGMAGIYYMLMQPAAKVDQETLTEMVKPSIDYMRHKRFRSGNYPSSLSNETDRLVHWCHGAPGVIHMLMQAYKMLITFHALILIVEIILKKIKEILDKKMKELKTLHFLGADLVIHNVYEEMINTMAVFKEEKYLKDAMECSDVIWQRGLLRKGYGICHGTAGNGYSFLSLYHLTRDKKYLYRACKTTSCAIFLVNVPTLRSAWDGAGTEDRLKTHRMCENERTEQDSVNFAEWCLDYGTHGCRIPDRPYSLFEAPVKAVIRGHLVLDPAAHPFSRRTAFCVAGMAGTVHFLSDILAPEASRFPAFELGSPQTDTEVQKDY
ncbi:hypothetical protein E2I00_010620, partial [Balaenoptera physalus]